MEQAQPTAEHQWLGRLVGDWTFSHDAPESDDSRLTKIEGTETFRAIGPLWIQGEAVAPMTEGGMSVSLMTLGWDPAKRRFVGTWIGSMMPTLWVYEGELDPSGHVLSLYSEGPAPDGSVALVPYKDVITFLSDNHRTLTGYTKSPEGTWTSFMTVDYHRR